MAKKTTKTKVEQKPSDKRVELWFFDEYNQGKIVNNSTDLNFLFEEAKSFLNELNVNNALTFSEKEKSWEAYLPVFVDKKGNIQNDMLYGGNKRNGKYTYYSLDNDTWKTEEISDQNNIRFYLGEVGDKKSKTEKPWFLYDKNGSISDISKNDLERKGVLFFKFV